MSPYMLISDKQRSLCRNFIRLIQHPVNKRFSLGDPHENEIVIPKGYPKFDGVKWEPVNSAELRNYIVNDETWVQLKEFKEITRGWKTWNGQGNYYFEKTYVNYDSKYGNEVLLRYKLPGWKYWNCLVSEKEKQDISDSNKLFYIFPSGSCTVFNYQKKFFILRPRIGNVFSIYEPVPSKIGLPIYHMDVCRFERK